MTDSDSQLVRDLEAIEREVPSYPSGLSTLRSLLSSLPTAVEPDVQSARAGVADPTGQGNIAGAGGIATGLQGAPPGFESGAGVGIFPKSFFGLGNLLRDPAFELVNTSAVGGAYNAISTAEAAIATDSSSVIGGFSAVDVWFAQQIGATAATMTYAGLHFRSNPDFSPYNSSSLSARIDPSGAGTHELMIRSSDWDAAAAPAYPYLIGAVRITTNDVNNLASITSESLVVEVYDVTSAVVRATTTIPISAIAQFDQSTQVVASCPYAGTAWEGHIFRIRIRLIVVSTGNAAVQEWLLGEPQLTQSQTEQPPPFAPIAASWIPTRVRQYGLNTTEANAFPVLATSGFIIRAGGELVWNDLSLELRVAGILGIERDGASGVTGIDLREGAAPAAPAGPAARIRLYANNDGHLHQIDNAGTDIDLTAGGGGGVSLGGVAGSPHIGTAGAVGSAGTAAESDHQHEAQISLSAGGAGSNNFLVRHKLSADTQYRFLVDLSTADVPQIVMGPGGATAPDIRLARNGANAFIVDDDNAHAAAVTIIVMGQYAAFRNATTDIAFATTDGWGVTSPQHFVIRAGGDLEWGPGGSARDVLLARGAAGDLILSANGAANNTVLFVESTVGEQSIVAIRVAGDANSRTVLRGDASETSLAFGVGGGTARDLRWRRSGTREVILDDNNASATSIVSITNGELWVRNGTGTTGILVGSDYSMTSQFPFRIVSTAGTNGIEWGPGGAARDLRIQRGAANRLEVDNNGGGAATFRIMSTGTIDWGGNGLLDVNNAKIRLPTGTGALTTTESYAGWQSTTKRLRLYDAVRERTIGDVGWAPYAFSLNFVADAAFTTALALAANGGSIAIPIAVQGHMLLESVSVRNTDAATQRTWGWDLYEQYQNSGSGGENTLTRVAASSANETFTPGAASTRTITAGSAPVYLAPGLYWLVIQSRHATSTFGLGSTAASTAFALNIAQTKTTTNPNGATLDFVAATWTKVTAIYAARLNGRVFGQTVAF